MLTFTGCVEMVISLEEGLEKCTYMALSKLHTAKKLVSIKNMPMRLSDLYIKIKIYSF